MKGQLKGVSSAWLGERTYGGCRSALLLALAFVVACDEGSADPRSVHDAASDLDASLDARSSGDDEDADSRPPVADAGVSDDAAVDPGRDAGGSDAGGDAGGSDAGGDAGGSDAGGDAGGSDAAAMLPARCMPKPSGELLFEQGFGAGINRVRASGDRLLAQDQGGTWILYDSSSWDIAAQGDRPCVVVPDDTCPYQELDMAGGVIAFQTATAIELRSNADGHVTGSIPRTGSFGVASDGSYVWTATGSALETWSTTGAAIATRPGNYEARRGLRADASHVRVAAGPAAADKIESISAQTGESSLSSAFVGTFSAFFGDSGRFLTFSRDATSVASVRVYSEAVVEEKLLPIENFSTGPEPLGGYGNFFWYAKQSLPNPRAPDLREDSLAVYAIEGSDAPVWSSTTYVRQRVSRPHPGGSILVPPSNGRLLLRGLALDLRGTSVQEVQTLPVELGSALAVSAQGTLFSQQVIAAVKRPAATEWEPVSCEGVRSAAPSSGHLWAFASWSRVLVVDLAARTLLDVIPVQTVQLEFSSDDSTLILQSGEQLLLHDVDTGQRRRELDVLASSYFDVARKAPRLLRRLAAGPGTSDYLVTDLDGTNVYQSYRTRADAPPAAVDGHEQLLSPSGQRFAFGRSDPVEDFIHVDIVEDGAVIATSLGMVSGWLDDTHVLIRRNRADDPSQQETRVFDVVTKVLSETPLPPIHDGFDLIDDGARINADMVTDVDVSLASNRIYDVATGQVLWSSPVASYPYTYRGRANDHYVTYFAAGKTHVLAR